MQATPEVIEGIIEFASEYDHIPWGQIANEFDKAMEGVSLDNAPTAYGVFNALEAHFGITDSNGSN